MRTLRGVLYLHALAWFLLGSMLVAWPGVLQALGQPEYVEAAWVRLFGAQSIGLALFMVLVGHRADDLWWWSWGFVPPTGGAAILLTLHAGFGLPSGAHAALWWILAAVAWGFAFALLVGLSRAALERPPHRHEPAPARDPHPRRRR